MAVDRPIIKFPTAEDAEEWFAAHHATSDGIFVTLSKKSDPEPLAAADDILGIALRYGWIDSQSKGVDEHRFLLTYTPRRSRSPWSKVNRERVEAMIEAGTLTPAGHAAVEQAKANGRWDAAYAGSAEFETPADFLEALHKNPKAAAFYETLSRQNHYAVYFRLNDAKKPETRARRIEKFVGMFERGEKLY